MSSVLPIPQLTRSSCYHMPSTIDGYATTDVDDLFNQYTLVQSKYAVDPLANVFGVTGQSEPEYYDVDDTPLPEEDGVLRLKMPIVRPLMMNRSEDNPPLFAGVSVHMGYIPINEVEAFENTVSEHSLQASRFTIPRGQMSVDQIIDRIRKVVFVSDDIHEIAPKNIHFIPVTHQDRILYSSTLLYATFDQYGNHRFAQFNVRLQSVKDQAAESIAIVTTHFQGDTRLSMEFFLTLRAYVLSNGNSECQVRNPELFNGFADQYIDDMSEPATLTMFTEVDEE